MKKMANVRIYIVKIKKSRGCDPYFFNSFFMNSFDVLYNLNDCV